MREGSEVALFMYGLVAAGGSTATELVIGAVLGLAAGVAVSALTYLGLVAIPQRRLFAVTTGLLAAGLAAQAVLFLAASWRFDDAEPDGLGHVREPLRYQPLVVYRTPSLAILTNPRCFRSSLIA